MKKSLSLLLILTFFCITGFFAAVPPAELVRTDVANFDGVLDSADTNVQLALDVLDDAIGTTLRGLALDAPVAGDDGKYIYYDHGNTKFDYGTPAGGGDMDAAVWDGDSDGFIDADAGGTDIDSSAATGTPYVTAGTWSISQAIAATTVDATTDFTVGGLVITDNTITDDGTLDLVATTSVDILGADVLNIGEDDAAVGTLAIFGGADTDGGGLAYWYLDAGDDASIDYYGIIVVDDDWLMGSDGDTDMLKFIAETSIQATVAVDVDAALTATTVDADTDFTVGGLVITDNTITDDGTLTLNATTTLLITSDLSMSAAQDFDLLDDDAAALSFDVAGKAGIISIDTQDGAEGVTFSGYATVTGVFTATAAGANITLADGQAIDLSNVTHSEGIDEGIALAAWANVAPGTDIPWVTWDTTGQALKVYDGGWVTIASSGAPTDAKYIVQQADATLSAEQALGALASGILYSTTTTGVVSIATESQMETTLGIGFGASKAATSGYILVMDGTDLESVVMSGDVTIAAGGATTVGDDSHAHVVSNIDAANSAAWIAQVSDETGTGLWVFATAPTFTTSIAFDDPSDTIAGVENQNLLDKTAAESISGVFTHAANIIVDDGTTDSPSLQFIDATNETLTMLKTDAGNFDIDFNTANTEVIDIANAGAGVADLKVDGEFYEGGTSLANTYQPLDTELTEIAGITGVQGDILFYDGSDWVALGYGDVGKYLQTRGINDDPIWAAGGTSGAPGAYDEGTWDNDSAAPTKDAVRDQLEDTYDGTVEFAVLNVATTTDPKWLFDVTDADDTDWVIGVNADADASSDDFFEFRQHATEGNLLTLTIDPVTGDVKYYGIAGGTGGDDAYFTLWDVVNPTADRTITVPDADVTLANIAVNTTHKSSDGSDHTFLDQSVVSGATPTFTATNITGFPADTIDAITEIAAALKSGSDTTLITGTAGTDTYTAVWNADGDIVDGYDPATKQGVLTNSAGLRGALSDETGTGIALFDGFTLASTADFGDQDITSVAKLEGVDNAIYIDMDSDGLVKIVADTEIQITGQTTITGDLFSYLNTSSKAGAYTIGTDDADENFGTLFTNSNVADLTLPGTTAVVGANGCLMQEAGVTGIMQLEPGTGSHLVYQGVEMTDGTPLASAGAATDRICWAAISADHYLITSSIGTWAE